MADLTTLPLQDNYQSTLSQSRNGATGTIYVNTVPSFTFPAGKKCYIVVNPEKSNMQVARISAYDATAKTITVDSITVDKGNGVAYTQQSHAVGSKVMISDSYQFREDLATAIDSKVDTNSDDTATGKFVDATARDAYFTSPVNWNTAYLTSLWAWTDYIGGARTTRATWSVVNASTTVAGKVEKADSGEVTAWTSTGWTGAELFVWPAELKTVTDTLNSLKNYWFWNWSDWAIWSWSLTITGSNNTYITKQYTTFAPWSNTVTITPTNCILHIKVQWDCNLTWTTFTFNGKWWTAWAAASWGGGATVNWGNWWTAIWTLVTIQWWAGWGNTQWTAPCYVINYNSWAILAWCWSGGWGWQYDQDTTGSAWDWWAWWGCLILEVGWNLTFSSTTMNFQWANGSNWTSQWWWWWGWWGTIYILYRWTLSWSPTTNVAWWSAWSWANYAWGNGWHSITTTGATWATWTWWAWWAWNYYIKQI